MAGAAHYGPEAGGPGTAARQRRRVLWASLIGTTVEFYDFYLYATASALIFAPVFFPESTPQIALFQSFAAYGVGFAARPVGGILAGHLGDRLGRARVLMLSLLVMGGASTLIGLLPGYRSWGIGAVAALILLRLVQGLASGAEWGGSALLSVEHAPAARRGLAGSVTQMGSAAGMLLATGIFALCRRVLGPEAFLAGGWRIPFLFSVLLVLVGLVIRSRVGDGAEFRRVAETGTRLRAPLLAVLRGHWRAVLITAGLRLVQPALYSILTVYTLGYLLERRGDGGAALGGILVVSALGLASTPLWGALSDRVGPRIPCVCAAAGIALLIWPYFLFLDRGPLGLLIPVFIVMMNILHDAIYGPQAAWFARQFPVRVRYSGISLGYQLGSVVSVGLTPLLAAWLYRMAGENPWPICAYISLLGALSILAALRAK